MKRLLHQHLSSLVDKLMDAQKQEQRHKSRYIRVRDQPTNAGAADEEKEHRESNTWAGKNREARASQLARG